MRKIKWIGKLFCLCLLVAILAISASAAENTTEFAGGEGTAESPYLIANATHLNNVKNRVLSAHYKLTADIVLTEADFATGGVCYNYGRGWIPIGNSTTPFTGTFDGDGHTITGLKVDVTTSGVDYTGLFGKTQNATILNLGVLDADISHTSTSTSYVGGIVAYANNGTIENCYFSGTVSAPSTAFSIDHDVYAGGIVGYATNGLTVSNCYNTGTVSASSEYAYTYAGGIVGYIAGTFAGGATSSAAITDCYNTGAVSASGAAATRSAGGILGCAEEHILIADPIAITTCYNTGKVTAGVGGIAGALVGTADKGTALTNCYYLATGDAGVGSGTAAGTECTVAQMVDQATFVGFDFTNAWAMGNGASYKLPTLLAAKYPAFAGGDGTETNPYLIATAEHLDNVRYYLSSHFKMTADIVFAEADFAMGGVFYNDGTGWAPIGDSTTAFTGTFDGDGHTITGLKQNSTAYGGLFGYVSGVTIKNLGMLDSNIYASGSAGGIVGYTSGSAVISSCYNTGAVKGTYAGGIVGYESSSAVISNCYNTGAVKGTYAGGILGWDNGNGATINSCYNTGNIRYHSINTISYIGGIVGYGRGSNGTINNCYNTGNVSATTFTLLNGGDKSHAGGICGYAGSVSNCYSVGAVSAYGYAGGITGRYGTIHNSYYLDICDVGANDSTSTTVKCTDEEMMAQSTFVGFDFADVWQMGDGGIYGFPTLRGVEHIEKAENTTDFAGGNGKPYNPYQISAASQLNNVRKEQDACYVLTADIVFTDADFAEGGTFYNEGALWQSVERFTGIFDGDGHTITGLKSNGSLFEELYGATVKNLGMVDSEVITGGIAEEAVSSTISNCYNSGSVFYNGSAYNGYVGGIAGYVSPDSVISNCYNTGSVVIVCDSFTGSASNIYAGGITSRGGIIHNCHNIGAVSANATSNATSSVFHGSAYSGGIVGYSANVVSNCYNTGAVSASSLNAFALAGGIAGYNETVSNSYNAGAVSAAAVFGAYAGGIASHASYSTDSNCYNTGAVSALSTGSSTTSSLAYAGGIAARVLNSAAISGCYSTGAVSASSEVSSAYTGGIAGYVYEDSTVSNCYYLDACDVGIGYGTGTATKCTREELWKKATFVGFDFGETWTMAGNEDYLYPELVGVPMIFTKTAVAVELATAPAKLSYYQGRDALDVTGGKITVAYDTGISLEYDLTADMVTGFDNTTLGKQTLTVTYGDFTDTFEIEIVEFPGEAQFNGVAYDTLDEALNAASTAGGGTVTLLDDAGAGTLVLTTGVTLDLNGNNLTTDGVMCFGGHVVDNSSNKSGKIVCMKGMLMLDPTNPDLAVWNGTDGYFFTNLSEVLTLEDTSVEGSYYLLFLPRFSQIERIAPLLAANGGEPHGVSVQIKLLWDGGGKTLTYSEDMIKTVYGGNAFTITLTDYEAFLAQNLRLQIAVEANGVVASSETIMVK